MSRKHYSPEQIIGMLREAEAGSFKSYSMSACLVMPVPTIFLGGLTNDLPSLMGLTKICVSSYQNATRYSQRVPVTIINCLASLDPKAVPALFCLQCRRAPESPPVRP